MTMTTSRLGSAPFQVAEGAAKALIADLRCLSCDPVQISLGMKNDRVTYPTFGG
jgi:hypothetical protein